MRKALKLYKYLEKRHNNNLFSDRNIGIASDLALMSDEEFDRVINE